MARKIGVAKTSSFYEMKRFILPAHDEADLIKREVALNDKEPTDIERCLSYALQASEACVMFFEKGEILESLTMHRYSGEWSGRAKGLVLGNIENELKKQILYQYAATARHAENRLMKKQAIQHYKENYKSYTSKDDAAFKIAENIVSAKFSTVRDWLKGVNPE